jgi:hypothetical protein
MYALALCQPSETRQVQAYRISRIPQDDTHNIEEIPDCKVAPERLRQKLKQASTIRSWQNRSKPRDSSTGPVDTQGSGFASGTGA